MISRLILLLLTFIASQTSSHGQSGHDLPPNPKAGKCYAKCIIADHIVDNITSEEITYPLYTGTDARVKTNEITIITQPKKDIWVLDSIKGNWVFKEEQLAKYETITVLRKTRKIPPEDIAYETFEVFTGEMYFQKRGETEWREVLCGNQITASLISNLKRSLIDNGYDISDPNNIMDKETKNALVKYQKDNGLPIGALDFKTLKSLNIAY